MGVAGGGLGAQPLLEVALVEAGGLGQVGGGGRAGAGELGVEAEAVADHDGGGVHHRRQIGGELADERLDVGGIGLGELERGFGLGHGVLLGGGVDVVQTGPRCPW